MLKIHHHPASLAGLRSPVVTAGTFDGVHLGHREIIRRLKTRAEEFDGESLLLTFDPHPRIALKKDDDRLRLLNTNEEKAALLDELGLGHLLIIPFTTDFAKQTQQEFVESFLVSQLHIRHLVVGFNHRFGAGRQGDFESLRSFAGRFGFTVEQVERKDEDQLTVSSTQIRNAIASGDLAAANRMLGAPYRMIAEVIHGRNDGHKLGFPTANLKPDHPFKLLPANGVYAVKVRIGIHWFEGMCNVGIRPTFGGTEVITEVNIFNFDASLYGQRIMVSFIDKLRDERRFNSMEELVTQLHIDRQQAIERLKPQH